MATQLDSRQRKYLKGLAHHLKAVVHIGKDGLSESLLAQIETQLLAHELIKVKLGEGSPLDRDEAAKQLPEKTGAAFVQNVGRVFVLYREHPEEPKIDLPFPRQMGDGTGDGENDLEESSGAPPDLGFATVRQRGPVDAPVAPPRSVVRETKSSGSERSERPRKSGGRAKARPGKRKPTRRQSAGNNRRGGSRSR